MAKDTKHVHFIGIAGTLIAPLAVAMKKQGWRVTGSDQAFYPPMSTYLTDNKIKIIPGYNPDKFKQIGKPNLAVMMSFLTPQNPEIKYLKKNNVEIISLGQLLEKYFIKKNSIVVTGNYGKTTITSLLAWILEVAGLDPTVLGGGYFNNFKAGVKIGKSNWSVSEGDEFKNWNITRDYKFSRRSRLLYQKPTHVVFTDATWDHYDQYPTKDEYLNTFIKFIKHVPKTGYVIGNRGGKNVKQVLGYSKSSTSYVTLSLSKGTQPNKIKRLRQAQPDNLAIKNIKFTKTGSEFELSGKKFKTPMLGLMGAQNSALAITLAVNIGISLKDIKKALRTYKGVKRRQEIRFKNKQITVMDDFAHSPVKLRGIIDTLRLHYPKNKIILIYQPGSKDKKALSKYLAKTFEGVDYIVLPRVSSIGQEARHFNALLSAKLKKTKLKNKIKYIGDDDQLVDFVHKQVKQYHKTKKHVIVLFAAQKGWRGMIEELVKRLR